MTTPEVIFEVDYPVLATRLDVVPHELDDVLRLFDGRRTLAEVLEECAFSNGDTVLIITRLRREGVLVEARPPAKVDVRQTDELAAWLADDQRPPVRSRRGMWIGAVAAAGLTFAFVRMASHPATKQTPAFAPAAVASAVAPPPPAAAPAEPPAVAQPALAEPPREQAPPAEDPGVKVAALLGDARAQLDKGRAKRALTAAEAAAALDGGNAEAWLYVGAARQELGRAHDARAAYEKYLALAPKGEHASEIRSVLRAMH